MPKKPSSRPVPPPPEKKGAPAVVLLTAAAVLVVALAVFLEAKRRQAKPGAGAVPSGATVSGEAAPVNPVSGLRIQTETLVTAGSAPIKARILENPGYDYVWTIQGGELPGFSRGAEVEWSAAQPGDVVLTATGTAADGKQVPLTVRIKVVAPAEISRFEAIPPAVPPGAKVQLTWTAKDVKALTLDPGGIDVIQQTTAPYEVKPTATTTYTLKATNPAGTVTSREITVKVVEPPQIQALRSEPVPDKRGFATLIAEFRGGKAEIRKGGAVLAASDTSPLRLEVGTQDANAVFELVVTNEIGQTASTTARFTAPPK